MGRFARIDSRFARDSRIFSANRFSLRKKPPFRESAFQEMGLQRGLDANHANFNANRREDAIRANLAKSFKIFFFSASRFAWIDSRRRISCESAKRWCANRLPTKGHLTYFHPKIGISTYVVSRQGPMHETPNTGRTRRGSSYSPEKNGPAFSKALSRKIFLRTLPRSFFFLTFLKAVSRTF